MNDIKDALKAADDLAQECSRVAGKLDLTGAVNLPNLVALCQGCRERLAAAVDAYREAKKPFEEFCAANAGMVVGHFNLSRE